MLLKYWTIILALFTSPLSAQNALGTEKNFSTDIVTTMSSLVFVVILIFFLARMLKGLGLPMMSTQKDLAVIRQVSVGPKERVVIVKVGEEQFLIGITAQSINLISRLNNSIQQEMPEKSMDVNRLARLFKKHDKE